MKYIGMYIDPELGPLELFEDTRDFDNRPELTKEKWEGIKEDGVKKITAPDGNPKTVTSQV